MDLCLNMLLEHIDAATERRIDRILRISSDGTIVALIQVHGEGLPRICINADLSEKIKAAELQGLFSLNF